MMNLAPAEVKGIVRSQHAPTGRIPFAFRADPVALDELRVDPTARQVFALVLDNAKNRGWKSRLSNATMGRILGRCSMTISRALGRLEAIGLVRRELIAGGRIRLAIHVTWEGVRRDDLTGQTSVRRESLTGSARESMGLGAGAGHTRVPTQSEISDGGSSPLDGKQAADYLKACVAAGKRGEPMPEPPVFANSQKADPPRGGYSTPPPSPNVSPIGETFSPTPVASPGAFLPSVGRMVASLGERLKAEGCGPRRVGPAKLARQLGEMRRKHGRRE